MARSSSSSKRGSLYADLEHLRTQFSSLDPESTGYIGYEELMRLVTSETNMDESAVPELLERLDRDKDGRVSFEDLQDIFELEREAIKRQKLEEQETHDYLPGGLISPEKVADFNTTQEYDTALDTTPGELLASPTPSRDIFQTTPVVLRHKRSLRTPSGGTFGQGRGGDAEFCVLSPIQAGGTPSSGNKSPAEADLATQMRHLTDIPASPGLNRRSKVLSWISESEDMFEDTGISREQTDGLLSPPMSPAHGSGDEAAHVRSILEGVCHTQDIGRDAVRKLCSHVQADPQEEQELLALLDHLDKERKGYVHVDEFVQGLQSMRTSASVTTSSPPSFILGPVPNGKPQRYNDKPIPKLSEPFSSTPNSGKRKLSHHTSTPLPPHRKTAVSLYGERPQLTVLDPNNSGFVGVDTLAQQWQRMGVEPPHNQSLEDALRESLPVDASRRISISEVATSLETAVLSNDHTQPTLRQAALLTFKEEIDQLRNQLHQVSMERDGLRTNLQRTTEESKKLVQEGDEQVERITKQSEKTALEKELRLKERLREVEREKEEEIKRVQELADAQRENLEREIEDLKYNEERLKDDLKIAQDEIKWRRNQDNSEFVGGERSDRTDRMEVEQQDGEGVTRLEELEQINADLQEQNQDLKEQTTRLQDRVDELAAENERFKQKYNSHRRRLQRQQSRPQRLKSASLSASRLDDHRTSRPRSGKRPSSASQRFTTAPSLAHISENLHVNSNQESDSDTVSPDVSPRVHGDGVGVGLEEREGNTEMADAGQEESDGSPFSSSDDGPFAKSTTSLMEEMQFEDIRERELDDLRREKRELEDSCRLLEQQLQHQQDHSNSEQQRQLQTRRRRQEELEGRIHILEQQKKNLISKTEEMASQLQKTEDNLVKQLDEVHRLRDMFSYSNLFPTDDYTQTTLDEMEPQGDVYDLEEERTESAEDSVDYQNLSENLQSQLDESRAEICQMEAAHKEEVERIRYEFECRKQRYLSNADEQNKALKRLGKELESSHLALEQYKHDAQSLEDQLQNSRQAMKSKEERELRELQLLQGRPQRKTLPLLPPVNEELMRLRDENKRLQDDIKSKVEEVNGMQKVEQSLLVEHAKELEMQTLEYHNQLAKAREEREGKLAALRTMMEKELHMSRERCEIQVQSAQQELKASHLTIMQLKNKMESAEKQCESLLHDVSQHKEAATMQASQISQLQEIKTELEKELQRYKDARESQPMQQAHTKHGMHNEELQSPLKKSQSRQEALDKELAMEEIDYPLETLPLTSPMMSPSRHSYQSDRSYHEEIVSQMKSQLEDLQMCLVHQGSSPRKANEVTLVQELLQTNSTLQANLEREQRERERELSVLETKNSEIQALRKKVDEHHSELLIFQTSVMDKCKQMLKSLQQRSDASIHNSSSKVEAAKVVVTQLIKTLHTRDERHRSALDTLIEEVEQSRITQESYRQEVEELHSTLDSSREKLDHSQQELQHTLHIKESEISELRKMLDKAHANYRLLQSQKENLQREKQKVQGYNTSLDVGLQVKKGKDKETHEGEREKQEAELQQKEMEMEGLREEVKRAEQHRSETQSLMDAIQLTMQSKEKEMGVMEEQIRNKEHEVKELQHKLQTIVSEPVEVVMQYVEAAPLESVSNAMFASMQKDLQAGRKHSLQLEVQHKEEVKKLKEELDQSMHDSFELEQQVHALKQAVQEQEAELRAAEECRETERRKEKENLTKIKEKFSQELDSAKSAAEAHRDQLRAVCSQVLTLPPDAEELDYNELAQRAQKEIATLYRQLSEEQNLRHEVEVCMAECQTEWEAQESQWQIEHEEEVRALRQRNSQLLNQLEDTGFQYQEFIREQERENSLQLKDLLEKQASLERELELRAEEVDYPSSHPQNSHEREVLLNIIEQLCMMMPKPLSLDIS